MEKTLLAIGNIRLAPQFYYLKGTDLHQKRQEDFLKNFDILVEKAIEKKASLLLVVGNFFDTFLPEPSVLSKLDQILKKMKDAGITLVLNGGPRDLSRDDLIYSCDYFKEKKGIIYFEDNNWRIKEIKGIKILAKKYSHLKNLSSLPEAELEKADFILLNTEEELNLYKDELVKAKSVLIPLASGIIEKDFIFLPQLENMDFSDLEKKKGYFKIVISKNNKIKEIELEPLPVREMGIREVKFSLKDNSILEKLKRVIKEKSPQKIEKIILKGSVLFEVYRRYNKEEIYNFLKDRFFFVRLENELEVEELSHQDFVEIKIQSPQEEFEVLVDKLIDKYSQDGNKEYRDFYQKVKKIGMDYLKKSEEVGETL